jgi:hypothetical protein
VVRYNLANGKTVLLTMDQYLDMTDELEQKLMAADSGIEINNPFADFTNTSQNTDEELELDIEEIPIEIIKDIKKEFDEDS